MSDVSRRRRRAALAPVLVTVTLVSTALVAAGPASAADAGTVLYVSPLGSDASSGRDWWRPLRTLQHARDVVRRLNQHMTGDITVKLLPGTYELSEPLRLDQRDSGTDGHTVVWTAAVPSLPTVISGGTRITGWRLTDPARHIWSAPVPAGLTTRQLYVQGVRAQRARGRVPTTLTATDTGYAAADATMAGWRNPSGIELVYTGGDGYWSLRTGGLGGWTEPRCPVAAISGTTITMAQPCWDNSTKRVMRTDGSGRTVNLVGPAALGNGKQPTYVENAYELLDQPGEWYLDPAAHRVSYIPRPHQPLWWTDVVAPRLETLVSGWGTATEPVHDIAFRGLQFSYATWLRPSSPEGLSEIQATYSLTGSGAYATQGLCQFVEGGTCPYGSWTKTPGNVSFGYAHRIELSDDVFAHLGAAGVDLGDGSQDSVVRGSVFTDISANGVQVGGVDKPLPTTSGEHTVGNQVVNNHLYGLPAEYHGGVAIDVGYTERSLIAHNQIDHTAYTGISVGWGGWPDKIKQPATPNVSHDNVIANNLIFHHMQLLADGGGIYTQGITGSSLADGEKVTGNVIHDQIGHGHAIYSDNGATFLTIRGNVLYRNQNDWGSNHANYTPPNDGSTNDPLDIEDNYWDQGDRDSTSKNVTLRNNRLVTPDRVPADIVAAAGLEPAYRDLLGKRVALPSVPEAPQQLAAAAGDGRAYVSWSPSFVENGGPVTSYTVTASPGGQQVTVSAADHARTKYAVVPGLANGTAYTFTVAAHNRYGASAPSLPSAAVTPAASTATVPPAPTKIKVNVGVDTVSVHWSAPASNGGAPILAYQISAPGVPTVTFTGHQALWADSNRDIFTAIGGLTPGRSYTFTVAAVNAVGVGAGLSAPAVTPAPPPAPTFMLDGARLALNRYQLRTGTASAELAAELGRLRRSADAALTAGPWAVTDKTVDPPSGDRHDYYSEAPYWWPNPDTPDGCPYIRKDGNRNPAVDRISDHAERGKAWEAIYDLALAWYYTGDARYAERAALDLRTWFLDPATRMNPSMSYAQVIHCSTAVNPSGLIESTEALPQVVDALTLLDTGAPGWTSGDRAAMRGWLTEYLSWMRTSPQGTLESAATNNHGSYKDLQDAVISLYLGQTTAGKDLVSAARATRIAVQVAADGSQPLELARTRPWHYSNFNATALCRLAEVGRAVKVDLWGYVAPNGGSLVKAVDFLIPGAVYGPGERWPYPELEGTFVRSEAHRTLHAAADEAGDAAAAAALPSVPVPPGGDTWSLVPAC